MGVSRKEIVDYLVNHAGFTTDFTKEKSTDHLFGIYMGKIRDAERYRQDVIKFYEKHPEIQLRPTRSEINSMGFLFLWAENSSLSTTSFVLTSLSAQV